MGRSEKYKDVIEKYEKEVKKLKELEEKEEKLSVTRELKFSDLQKEIDNSITIADAEELANLEDIDEREDITDTSEIQVEDTPDEVEAKEDTKEIVEEEPVKKPIKRKVKKEAVKKEEKIIDEPTEELIAMDGEESDKDEDDLFLTSSMKPLKKKLKLRGIVKLLIWLIVLGVAGVLLFFKVLQPLFYNLVNSDPRKVFENTIDMVVKDFEEKVNQYAYDETDIISVSLNTRIDSNMENFTSGDNTKYSVSYAYDAKSSRMLANVGVSRGETYNNLFLVDKNMVYQKLSSYEQIIKLEELNKTLKDNDFYKEFKESFDKAQMYILPSEYIYYYKTTANIIKESFDDSMFDKKMDSLHAGKEDKRSALRNTLTLKKEDVEKINKKFKDKAQSDKRYKKVYNALGSIFGEYKELKINIYTKLNNKIVGFELESDGFVKDSYYESKNGYTAYFNINDKKIDISRENETININFGEPGKHILLKINKETENKIDLSFEVNKDKKKYVGELELNIDKDSRRYTFDFKMRRDDKFFNATGSIDYKVDKTIRNTSLMNMIDPPIREYDAKLEEFKNSFSSKDLYQKYDSWYSIATKLKMFVNW